jgi:serine phosphatase RsbU (regulator of sigma subunit)/anti-sigma regulatory factor (Ser/Thr protein kinase)
MKPISWLFNKEQMIEQESFVYPAKAMYVPEIKQKLTDICKRNNFAYRDLNNLLIVLDEACSNIIRHAYKDVEGDILFETRVTNRGIYMTLVDRGKSFDWHRFKTPDLNHYVSIGKKGGLGVWIIRKLTDRSDYKITQRGNELILAKYHSSPSIIESLTKFMTSAKSVREKFVFATSTLILLLLLGVYMYFVLHERSTLKDKFIAYNSEIIKSIAESSKERIIKSNYLSLIRLLKEIKKNNENIDSVFLLNEENRIIAHNNADFLYDEYEAHGKIREEYYINKTLILRYPDRYELVEPVVFKEKDIGEVHLILMNKGLGRVMSSKQINFILVGFIVLGLTVIGIYWLLGLITKPIQALHEGVVAIGDGRLEHRIEIDGEDEFSQIARAFNDMAVKFKGAQESIIEQEKMQKEIAVAKEIQQTLLPKEIPDTKGFDIASLYRSAKEVGGDYYDVMNVGQNLIAVVVADVSGKGVPGSLVMTITRTVMRLTAIQNKSAKSVLTKVNNFVKEDMKKGMFVTAFYLVLDSVTREINFASAGHDPLILYRAKENKCYYVKPKGFPLGISLPEEDLFKKVMVEEKVKLQKDDLICVYTDGIVEAMNGRREIFGEQRFMECIKKNGRLPSSEFIQNLDNEIKEFTQGYPQNDDITIVVIKEQKSDTAMLGRMEREIAKLKKKKMKIKDIEKKLGVNIKHLKEIRRENKERGGRHEKLRFMTFEMKRAMMKVVIEHPEWNGSTYEKAMQLEFGPSITESLINNELKRVNLLTMDKRKAYSVERKIRPAVAEKPKKEEPGPEDKKPGPPAGTQDGGGQSA